MHQQLNLILLRFGSFVVAVYAIIVLIETSPLAFEGRRPHFKFWSLKGCLVATMLSHRLLEHFWNVSATERAGAVTTLVAAPFALLMYFAYPTRDLISDSLASKEDANESAKEPAAYDSRVPAAAA